MNDAVGMIEMRGFTAMVKTANVELVGFDKIGGSYVTAIARSNEAQNCLAFSNCQIYSHHHQCSRKDGGVERQMRRARCRAR